MQSQIPSVNEVVKICRLVKIQMESRVEKPSGEQKKLLKNLEMESIPFINNVALRAIGRRLYRTETGILDSVQNLLRSVVKSGLSRGRESPG